MGLKIRFRCSNLTMTYIGEYGFFFDGSNNFSKGFCSMTSAYIYRHSESLKDRINMINSYGGTKFFNRMEKMAID